MNAETKLLVVDDEQVVCESCKRIFGTQGFEVEVSNDSKEGLQLASEKDYSAILLDFKMPNMDGLEFLEVLRKTKPEVPVIMITGYASVPSAAAAMRMGASDYIPKPFTPDELLAAVRRLALKPGSDTRVPKSDFVSSARGASVRRPVNAATPAPAVKPAPGVSPAEFEIAAVEYLFLDEAWMKMKSDATAEVGALLSRDVARGIKSIRFPRMGEVVYRGLPLALLTLADKSSRVIPSPVTGEVVAINHMLAERPNSGWENPLTQGWIARVRPANEAADRQACSARSVVLLNNNPARAAAQAKELVALGCAVQPAANAEEALAKIEAKNATLAMLDAAGFGEEGPAIVERIHAARPAVKVVVIGDCGSVHEPAYRAAKIFYYAVEPFLDKEIIDILASAFQSAAGVIPTAKSSDVLPETMSRVRITNRRREEVSMLVSGRTLHRHAGLGRELIATLHRGAYPVSVDLGTRYTTLLDVVKEVNECDRLVVLLAEDTGRIPGSMSTDSRNDLSRNLGEAGKKVVTLSVQPNAESNGLLIFDERTTKALAEHIAREMTRK